MSEMTLYPLGCLDDLMPDIDLPFILSFACPSTHHSTTKETLSHSFTSLLEKNPWLGGYIHSNVPNQQEKYRLGTKFLSIPPQDTNTGANTVEASQRIEFQDLTKHHLYSTTSYLNLVAQDMPTKYLNAKILMPNRGTPDSNINSALRARVSFIKDGVFVVLSTSHALLDATSLAEVFGVWAAIARGESAPILSHRPILSEELGIQVRHEDEALNKISVQQESSSDPTAIYNNLKTKKQLWWMLGLDYRPLENSSAKIAKSIPPKQTHTKIFLIKKDALQRLKTDCTQTKTSWISTNDALSALLWRCIVRARIRTPEWRSRTSSLMYAMNIRSSPALKSGPPSLSPPPEPRLANIVLYSINTTPVPDVDISYQPSTISALASTALNIRSAVQTHTSPDLVAQALQLVATIPDVRRLGLVYPTWLEHDVVISSLSRLPLYSTSWGNTFGEPENGELSVGVPDFVRWPECVFEGITFIMPRRMDGGLEVVVTMAVEDMPFLEGDEEWCRYIGE